MAVKISISINTHSKGKRSSTINLTQYFVVWGACGEIKNVGCKDRSCLKYLGER